MDYKTYHYGDNGINDNGWGCSYRNIQTIISCYKKYYNPSTNTPNISEILLFFKKNRKSSKSRELWIEPYDIARYLNFFDNKLIGNHYVYVTNDTDFSKILKTDVAFYLNDNLIINDFSKLYSIIKQHFKNTKLPVVIDDGVFSYCFTMDNNNKDNNKDTILLIDPHQPNNPVQVKTIGFLKNRFWMIFFPYSIGI